MGVEEEREPRHEVVDRQPPLPARFDVGEPIGQREGQFLDRGRAGLADVVAGDRDRVPEGNPIHAELHLVDQHAQVGFGREQPFLLGDVLLENVVLEGPSQPVPLDTLVFRRHQQETEQDLGGPVDRHRDRDVVERNAVHQLTHVVGRVDGYAAMSDLAEGPLRVAVEAHEGGHVECHRQPVLAFGQEMPEPGVGVLHRREPGELTNRPEPTPVSGGVDAAGVRIDTRIPDPGRRLASLGQSERGDGHPGERLEAGPAERGLVVGIAPLGAIAHGPSSAAGPSAPMLARYSASPCSTAAMASSE